MADNDPSNLFWFEQENRLVDLVTVPEWTTKEPAARPMILRVRPSGRGFLPVGCVGMLAAPGGAGKSRFLMQLAVAVASGKAFVSNYSVVNSGKVFLAMAEETGDELRQRYYWAMQSMKLTPDEEARVTQNLTLAYFYGTKARSQIIRATERSGHLTAETQFAKEIGTYLRTNGPWRLICFDPASRFGGPELEISASAATNFVATLEALSLLPQNPTVLVSHHTNKASRGRGITTDASAARGSVAFSDGVRWQCNLERTEHKNMVVLRHVKTNNTPIADEVLLWQDEELDGALRVPNQVEMKKYEFAVKEERKRRKEKE